MAYEKKEWVNDQTLVNAENMNHIEEGIAEVDDRTQGIDKSSDGHLVFNGKNVAYSDETYNPSNKTVLAKVGEDAAGNMTYNGKSIAIDIPDATESEKGLMTPTQVTKLENAIPKSWRGVTNGVASLDNDGKVPAAQLPSYVDDVVEYDSFQDFPEIGEDGKIYVDTDTNKTYRWSGHQYVIIGSDLALGETSSTAFAGDKGKVAYEFAENLKNRVSSDGENVNIFATGNAEVYAKDDVYITSESKVEIEGTDGVKIAGTVEIPDGIAQSEDISIKSDEYVKIESSNKDVSVKGYRRVRLENDAENGIDVNDDSVEIYVGGRPSEDDSPMVSVDSSGITVNGDMSDSIGTLDEVRQAFTDGCNTLVNGVASLGTRPASNSPSDIISAMNTVAETRRTQGQDDVKNNPNAFNLYTAKQYQDAAGSAFDEGAKSASVTASASQGSWSNNKLVVTATAKNATTGSTKTDSTTTTVDASSIRTAGQNDVKNNPNSYSLYTKAQYDARYTAGYNAGYSDGEDSGWDDGYESGKGSVTVSASATQGSWSSNKMTVTAKATASNGKTNSTTTTVDATSIYNAGKNDATISYLGKTYKIKTGTFSCSATSKTAFALGVTPKVVFAQFDTSTTNTCVCRVDANVGYVWYVYGTTVYRQANNSSATRAYLSGSNLYFSVPNSSYAGTYHWIALY